MWWAVLANSTITRPVTVIDKKRKVFVKRTSNENQFSLAHVFKQL